MKTPTTLERAVGRDLLIVLACAIGQLAYSGFAVFILYHFTKVDADALLTWWFGYLAIGVPILSAYVVDYTITLEDRITYGRRKDDVPLQKL
ncbi:hypothetical protein pEaSNUABM11_00228 [Erwinia phage pEa_SNUABM_11]|nr:hypothetical protein pEaSNUABM11_00228 [Erwinia phage pEa_SNUABM_11]